MSTTAAKPLAKAMTGGLSFMGFARLDGRVGVRNHLAVISTVALSNRIAELAAQRHEAGKGEPVLQIKGEFQRGLQLADAQLQDKVIAQLVDHPNIGAALVLCHDRRAAQTWQKLFSGKPVEVLAVMDGEGVENAIQLACQALARLSQQIREQVREYPALFQR